MKIFLAAKAGFKSAVTPPFKWAHDSGRFVMGSVKRNVNMMFRTKFNSAGGGGFLDAASFATAILCSIALLNVGGYNLCAAGILSTGAALGLGILAAPFALTASMAALPIVTGAAAFLVGVAAMPINFVRGCNSIGIQTSVSAPAAVSSPQTPQEAVDDAINKIQQLPESERQAAATQLKKRLTTEFGAAVESEELTVDINTEATKPRVRLKKGVS